MTRNENISWLTHGGRAGLHHHGLPPCVLEVEPSLSGPHEALFNAQYCQEEEEEKKNTRPSPQISEIENWQKWMGIMSVNLFCVLDASAERVCVVDGVKVSSRPLRESAGFLCNSTPTEQRCPHFHHAFCTKTSRVSYFLLCSLSL